MIIKENKIDNEILRKLKKTAKERQSRQAKISRRILVCAGSGCVANGALDVIEKFKDLLKEKNLQVEIIPVAEKPHKSNLVDIDWSGCQGFSQMGPLVTIEPENILYVKVKTDDVPEIVEKTLEKGEVLEHLLYKNPSDAKICRCTHEIPFYTEQTRIVLDGCGKINPESLADYLGHGGYESAIRAYFEMSQEEIINAIIKSGLRGRGGGVAEAVLRIASEEESLEALPCEELIKQANELIKKKSYYNSKDRIFAWRKCIRNPKSAFKYSSDTFRNEGSFVRWQMTEK